MFWLRVMLIQGYYTTDRLDPLLQESDELLAIIKTIIARIKKRA